MKKSLALFLLAIIFTACSREKETFQKSIIGVWELEQNSSWTGLINYPAGNGNLFILQSNGQYQMKRHDTVTNGGSYFIEYTKDCSGSKQYFFRAEGYESHVLNLKDDKLYLSTSSCLMDGGSSIYHKKE